MRSRFLRLWMVCFALVLLPVQSFAATVAGPCHGQRLNHHTDGLTVSAHHAQHSHHHADNVEHKAPTAIHLGFDAPCGHCSPCCVAAVVSTEVSVQLAPLTHTLGSAPSVQTPPQISLARLERPPRNFA